MMRTHWWMAILTLALLALAGCGRPRVPVRPQPEAKPPETPVATTMQNSTVKIADPKGAWTFEAVSKTLEAPHEDGPYHLTKVTGQFQQVGRPPVDMRADRMTLDRQAERIELEGAVRIAREGVMVEGERLNYDLKTGKVLSDTPTKTTIGPKLPGVPKS
jgi:LPS export ABC transporter protein LptC